MAEKRKDSRGRNLKTGEYYDSQNKRYMFRKILQNAASNTTLPYVDDSGHVRGQISGFVFVNTYGNVWSESCFRKLIQRIVEHFNSEADKNNTEQIEDFCPHMVRHTYTSLAYSAGADVKIVSQNLGHASTAVTLDTYTHLTEDKKQEQEAVAQTVKIS